jgi:hypothetical protein
MTHLFRRTRRRVEDVRNLGPLSLLIFQLLLRVRQLALEASHFAFKLQTKDVSDPLLSK